MSGKDHDQFNDAAFAAFLQGDDPLARDLAALDQPASPPSLDAAIQSRIAAALAAEKLAGLPAANDPAAIPAIGPVSVSAAAGTTAAAAGATAGVRGGQRWQSRWQLPLALAAGVAAISVALPLWQTHDPVTESMVAASPAAPATSPAPQAAPVPEQKTLPAAASPQLAPPGSDATASPPRSAQHASRPVPPTAPKTGLADAVIAEDAGRAPPAAMQPAPAPAPAPPPPPPAPVAQPAPAQSAAVATDSLAGNVIANATSVRPSPQQWPLPASERAANAGTDRRSAPRTAPAHAPAPLAFAPMAPVVEAAPAEPAKPAELAAPARTVSVTGSRIPAPHETQPAAWLQKIEALLQANERGAALAEWQKFRAAYPAYPVPDKLSSHFPPAAN
jgi:hypothetical protein